MGYCSSALDAKDQVKGKIQLTLRDAGVEGDTVVLTGGDGVMMSRG